MKKNLLAGFHFIELSVYCALFPVIAMLVKTHNGLIKSNPEMMEITFTQISARSD